MGVVEGEGNYKGGSDGIKRKGERRGKEAEDLSL
jgi:hypothetical protein